ncbi:glycosyltransferase family 4 protein [Citrobacter portucalensis]|uniref:glycosyltransferase family 4 protein n=1 Tax=Citrobacter portucalensis TaxID=1639133 RepID=UPI0023B08180|nr:glycosyltransferase family 4 protein [Citrobacter portucalensis]
MKRERDLKIDVVLFGARMHYAVPKILHKKNLLNIFFTDFYIGNKRGIRNILTLASNKFKNNKLLKLITSRNSNELNKAEVISFDCLGINRIFEIRKCKNSIDYSSVMVKNNIILNNKVINHYNKTKRLPDVIYGFNTCSLELFKYAKDNGIHTILEQTIAPKKVELEIFSKYTENPQLEHLYIEREYEEWKLADLIIAPSKFVKSSLISCGVDEQKISLVPYGVEQNQFKLKRRHWDGNRTLNFIFVGEVGIRKGADTLIDAFSEMTGLNITLKLVGKQSLELANKLPSNIELIGQVPRTAIPDLYYSADCFILPSLCEGSATVTYEAMSSGIPVIATKNAGSLVEHEFNGLLIDVSDKNSIISAVKRLLFEKDLYLKLLDGVVETRGKVSLDEYSINLLNRINKINV